MAACGEADDRSEADERLAQAALIDLADLPAGWTAKEPDADEDEGAPPCLQSIEDDGHDSADAEGPQFDSPNESVVAMQSVAVYADAGDAADDFALLNSRRTATCLSDYLHDVAVQQSSQAGLEVGDASVEPLASPAVGDRSTASRVVMAVTAGDTELALGYDLVTIHIGRGVSVLMQGGVADEFDDALLDDLAHVAADRLADALES